MKNLMTCLGFLLLFFSLPGVELMAVSGIHLQIIKNIKEQEAGSIHGTPVIQCEIMPAQTTGYEMKMHIEKGYLRLLSLLYAGNLPEQLNQFLAESFQLSLNEKKLALQLQTISKGGDYLTLRCRFEAPNELEQLHFSSTSLELLEEHDRMVIYLHADAKMKRYDINKIQNEVKLKFS